MSQQGEIPVHTRRDRYDPVPELARLRAERPLAERANVSRGTTSRLEGWLATGFDEVREVLGGSERFSTLPPADSKAESLELVQAGNLLRYDPPEHTRLRQMLTPEFTVRRMRRMAPHIEAITEDCMDTLEEAGPPADLMRHFAWSVPALVTCELLGIPRDDRAELARRLDELNRHTGTHHGHSASNVLFRHMIHFAALQRKNPGEELIGMLVREHGDDISNQELAGISLSLMAAGIENIACMLGPGIQVLLEHPDQLALLRERPELIDQAVEELLRYVSVIPTASPRTALEDIEVAGHVVKAGERVVCSLFAANRLQNPDGPRDDFDITRTPVSHVAFGHGIHHCVGAPLARMVLRTAYPALLRRFPGLRLAVPAEEISFRPAQSLIYGVNDLPVTW